MTGQPAPSLAVERRGAARRSHRRQGKSHAGAYAVGPEVAGVLVDICCELRGLEEAEKANGWPQRAGKVVLPIALTRLARHYGLIGGDETHRRQRSGLRHWGSEDYRPTLEVWSKARRDP
jgi:hypothetical protein